MRVQIIGAGIVGLSTALALAECGCGVEVLDPLPPGSGTSRANGGQLSYAYIAPLASPEILPKLPKWLLAGSSPTRVYDAFDPVLWRWGTKFLRACTRSKAHASVASLGPLGRSSQQILNRWRVDYKLDFDWRANGKLVFHRDPDDFHAARAQVAWQASLGIEQQILSPRETVDLEPALAHLEHQIRGAVWTPTEEVGDCYKLCQELARTLRQLGGEIRQTRVTGIRTSRRRLVALTTDDGDIDSSAAVVAAGIASRNLLKPLGISLPLYPLKGYSLTYDDIDRSAVPKASVTDYFRKTVCARIGNRLRLAGIADMDGQNLTMRPSRMALLKEQAAALLPVVAARQPTVEWVGLRPATPDGIPVIGSTRVDGLWVNAGQGALGFTLAPASAVEVAKKIVPSGGRQQAERERHA
ncbi:MAG TPA: FAD-dependent oxidoreductase [Gammaproteobacteria bacterium]|nr:FAD-dependent oxidoreductase [Gammaproteobacteria bacterium]